MASQRGAGAPLMGPPARVNECRCLPAVPTAAARSSEHEAEHPEDQPDEQQDPEDVQRSGDEPAATEQQEQEYQNDDRGYQFPSTSFRRKPRGLSRFYL